MVTMVGVGSGPNDGAKMVMRVMMVGDRKIGS